MMHVDAYERFWMFAAAGIIVVFITFIGITTVGSGVRPPSHIETIIDPQQTMSDPRFAQPGVATLPDGRVTVTMVAGTFFWLPAEIRVPAGRPVTFRLAAMDVTHGFEIARTNVNTMVVPGYVSQLTTTFDRPGEYLIVCNEYCGTGHHTMGGKVIVEAAP
jgi:cytochrome c oxidase subunit 2